MSLPLNCEGVGGVSVDRIGAIKLVENIDRLERKFDDVIVNR